MAENGQRSTLHAEHLKLKRQTEELHREHQRLLRQGATRAEWRAHQRHLSATRVELEGHFLRLRKFSEQRHLDRQQALADELHG